jgi:hypothetical protein
MIKLPLTGIALVTLSALIVGTAQPVKALDCNTPLSAAEEYDAHDYVFLGTLSASAYDTKDDYVSRGSFRVQKAWKGEISEINNSLFFFNFWNGMEDNKQYVVYAKKSPLGATIPLCNRSGSTELDYGQNELQTLDTMFTANTAVNPIERPSNTKFEAINLVVSTIYGLPLFAPILYIGWKLYRAKRHNEILNKKQVLLNVLLIFIVFSVLRFIFVTWNTII